jgi:outer membrane protein
MTLSDTHGRVPVRARRFLAALLLLPAALAAQTPAPAPPAAVTLADAIRLAEKVQPRVVQAEGNVRTADARVRAAKGSFLPNLNLSSSGNESFSQGPSRVDQSTGQVIDGNFSNRSFSTNLSASVDLFTGFRRGADVKAATSTREANSAALVDARFQQALNTTNQFFDALAGQQLLRVREASVRRAEEQLKVSVARLKAGSATRSDSLRSRVTLGNAQLQLIQAQTALATAEANLARLIGASGRVQATDDSSFYQRRDDIDTAAVRSEAGSRSPQVQSALASEEAAKASLRSSRSAYWPTLALSANTGFNGSRANDYDFFNQRQLSLSLNWAIFNRFNREQQIATQAVNLDVAEAQAAETARLVQANLTTRLAELESARARVGISETSVAAATEDLRVQQERYRLGASTIVDVLTSQEALNQAEVDVVNARFDYLRAKAQIEALIGRAL